MPIDDGNLTWVFACSLVSVDEIQTNSGLPQQGFTGGGNRGADLLPFHNLRATGLVDPNSIRHITILLVS
jgi:hypothetical protein